MANKLMTAKDVVASIKDGMTIGIGGRPRRKPMALVRECCEPRQGSDRGGLWRCRCGHAVCGRQGRWLIFAFVSLDFIPLEPYFRKARQSGEIEAHGN